MDNDCQINELNYNFNKNSPFAFQPAIEQKSISSNNSCFGNAISNKINNSVDIVNIEQHFSHYIFNYLTNHIGKWVRLDFSVGNSLDEKIGIIKEVTENYVILKAINPCTEIFCDINCIKFATVILSNTSNEYHQFNDC